MIMFKRKFNKLRKDPILFFKDAYWNFRLKKQRNEKTSYGTYQYCIICPTFNVDEYIDDFFQSIKNQTLDFTKHIHVIFVDDGSTDLSAKKIEKFKQKYPRNVTYLYKTNGGLSSARNYGLDYLEDNNIYFDYVTFTDPDDILDKDFFKSLDNFFIKNKNCKIASSNLIYFYEHNNTFRDIHPLRFRYVKTHTVQNDFGNDLLLSAATSIYNLQFLYNLGVRFDENVKPSFEDCKFNSQLLIVSPDVQVGFVKEARYLYRQRENNTSLMNNSWKKVGLFTNVPKNGVLNILELANKTLGYVPIHIQRVALFHCIGYYRRLVNADYHVNFLTIQERQIFKDFLKEIFKFIDVDTIIKCEFSNLDRKTKVGILGLYKGQALPIHYTYVNYIDKERKEFCISYFSFNTDDTIKVTLDDLNIEITEEKFILNDFMGDKFSIERRFLFKYEDTNQNLAISINNRKVNLTCFTKGYTGGAVITELISSMNKNIIYPNLKDTWILMDRKDRGDDNAEHFYRYLQKKHPEQNIFYAISKNCSDWKRLERDGFNLLDYGSSYFSRELKNCTYIVSSHLFIWNHLVSKGLLSLASKKKIWLQHGVICNNNANVVNTKHVDFMVTSTKPEYNSIAANFTDYNLLPSQVLLSGLPRHDSLIKKSKVVKKEKIILVMPTWRTWLNQDNISDSEYLRNWVELLSSEKLNSLLNKYGYKIVFAPHQELNKYSHLFVENQYISIWNPSNNESMQELFLKSSCMITDYSSVAFEMGFLNKCVFYYQFDQSEFYSKHYKKGYFDFYNDGFGPVAEQKVDLLKQLESYLKSPQQMEKKYTSRMDVFAYKDGRSCERIYQRIMNHK
ncbi:glycosyltransferase [Actinobacillus pleuropneumoniae]|uniref:Capsular polysaccharide synthesis protein B n=2 Tax=Actinobacillus pleuropneumoniae TaxID=715 RepID=A0A0F7R6C5_ACTPL|nr:glycosyltransferase [Actinobacillus pleuropneumoniae]BAR72993.1 capsular polysaccharide synthesis protein B [Actinobacillus pleuropneumoniae]